MLLTDITIKEFTELLASDAPTPGGGAAAALAGALGVSLAGMVGALTAGNAKYSEHAEFTAELLERAQSIRVEFLALIDEDAETFKKMSAAYKLPKKTEADKAARSEAVQSALIACADPPLKMMALCGRAIELTERAVGKTNRNVDSDLGVAALCLKAAMQSAWLNVLINVASIKDGDFVAEYREKGESIIAEAAPIADGVYEKIMTNYLSQLLPQL